MNLGDEAILECMLKQLTSSLDVEVVVFSFNAQDTEKRHKVRAITAAEMTKEAIMEELSRLDLFVLGGGGILFDELAETFLRNVVWAKELKIPVMLYAISVGPLNDPTIKKRVVEVLSQVDIITVRERESKKILGDLGITKEIEVTADPALLLEPTPLSEEILKKEGIDPKVPFIGFSVREPGPAAPDLTMEHYFEMLAGCADFIIERFESKILFIPLERGTKHDPQYSHAVISKMTRAQKATVLKEEYTSAQILYLMRSMSFAVGMRLHFLIFAGLNYVPFVPLPYASKVKGFLEDLEMPTLPIAEWNTGKICALIDRAWDERSIIKHKLEKGIPPLKEKAKRTNQILCEFIKNRKK